MNQNPQGGVAKIFVGIFDGILKIVKIIILVLRIVIAILLVSPWAPNKDFRKSRKVSKALRDLVFLGIDCLP